MTESCAGLAISSMVEPERNAPEQVGILLPGTEARVIGPESGHDLGPVIGAPDEEAGEIPVAFVVARGELDDAALMEWVAERVAPHMRVRRVEQVEEIPCSPSGKILRRELRARV